jgi:hypothetical protein
MARTLDTMPPKSGPSRGKYDWTNWLNGQPWQLDVAEDGDITPGTKPKAFRAALHQAASKRSGKYEMVVQRTEGKGDDPLTPGSSVAVRFLPAPRDTTE